MAKHFFTLLAVLTAVLACGRGGEANATPDGWYGDLESARADALRTGRPILAVFR